MSSSPPTTTQRGTPWWVVLGIFVVLPVTLSFVLSRQAAAQLIRRKAVASSHGWAIENKNEGQRVWILHGFHRDVEFEAVHLLREPRQPYDTQAQVWLDPARHHLPVQALLRVRATGEGTELRLQALK